ncbi:MAG TPA: ATP-binding protein [Pedobacter sp.]|nr:ATP-binding protein [Pedobacter sp.]
MTSLHVNLRRVMRLIFPLCFLLTGVNAHPLEDIKQDSVRIVSLLESTYKFMSTDHNKAAYYAQKAIEMSRRVGFTKELIVANNLYANVLISKGKYLNAYEVASESVELSKKIKNEKYLARSYTTKSMTGIFLGHFQMAANNLLDAAKIIERTGNKTEIQSSLNMLSIIFTELKNKEKALAYALRAEKLGKITKDPGTNLMTLMQLARGRALNRQFVLSNMLFEELLVKSRVMKDTFNITYSHIYYAELAIQENKYAKALGLYNYAYKEAVRTNYPDFLIYANGGLAKTYYELHDYASANAYLNKGIYHARTAGSENMLRELLLLGAQVKERQNDLSASLTFRKEYEELNSKLLNLDLQQNIHRLEEEFQSSDKEREIAKQKLLIANNQLKIHEKDNYIVASISLVCILVVSILLIYLRYRHKQKIAQKNMFLLEKEKEVQILKAMMSGEETERSRLAKDLHDGVGGLLSATKMHLSILQNDPGFHGRGHQFNHTVSMLDTASHEIRMIAHNLAPELLEKLGLHKALSAYFSRLQSPEFKINYIKVGEVPRMEGSFELLVYRVIQELINNVIKHAYSNYVLVQMSYHDHMLSITVEDNGVGLNGEEGVGFSNLRSRVAAVSGYIEIESAQNNGTTVFVEFDVTQYISGRLIEIKQDNKITYDTDYYRNS